MTGVRQFFWLFLLPVAGCMIHPAPEAQKVIVEKTTGPIQLDGSLNEDSWRRAACYPFLRPRSADLGDPVQKLFQHPGQPSVRRRRTG